LESTEITGEKGKKEIDLLSKRPTRKLFNEIKEKRYERNHKTNAIYSQGIIEQKKTQANEQLVEIN